MIKVKIHSTNAKTFEEFKERYGGHPGLAKVSFEKREKWLKDQYERLKPKNNLETLKEASEEPVKKRGAKG